MRIACITHKLRRFGELSPPDKLLFLRAIFWLAVARVRLSVTPFQELAAGLAHEVQETEADAELLRRVGFAVSAAAANVPWRSDCFPQTLAARSLLKALGYASTIHLGVDRVGGDELLGHAWLTCGETVVVGGEDLDRYTEMLT